MLRTTIIQVFTAIFIFGCGEGAQTHEEQKSEPVKLLDEPVQEKKTAVSPPKTVKKDHSKAIMNVLKKDEITSARLISSRTLSSKIRFENGTKAVFKPILKYDKRATREVAVYKLARSLGIDSVPISTIRKLRIYSLVAHVKHKNPKEAELLAKKAKVDNKGYVSGAVIQWIDGLDPDQYKKYGGRLAFQKLVLPARPFSEEDTPLAANVSNMIVLDYLVGNWDRFSGGNVFLSKEGDLVLLDHNGSFAPWSDRQKERMNKLLLKTERFSSKLFLDLKTLDATKIEKILGEDPWHGENRLISKKEVDLILERRDQILTHIKALLERSGPDSVLPFP